MGRNNQPESEFKTFDPTKLIEAYRTYFTHSGMKNAFLHIEEINSPDVQCWISKSKNELNRYVQYIISQNTFEKEKPDYYTCQAVHESLNGCSVSIVFSLFNIFATQTKTRASLFDQSIYDYLWKELN